MLVKHFEYAEKEIPKEFLDKFLALGWTASIPAKPEPKEEPVKNRNQSNLLSK